MFPQQLLIYRRCAEFINDDGGVGQIDQQFIQQRGLAAAEEAG